MTIKEKNEIIDEVKRQMIMEMEPEYRKHLEKQSVVMCRVFSALDYLEGNLDDYYSCVQSYMNETKNGQEKGVDYNET